MLRILNSFAQSLVITSTEKAFKKLEEGSNETIASLAASQGPIRRQTKNILFPSGNKRHSGYRKNSFESDRFIKSIRSHGVATKQPYNASEDVQTTEVGNSYSYYKCRVAGLSISFGQVRILGLKICVN